MDNLTRSLIKLGPAVTPIIFIAFIICFIFLSISIALAHQIENALSSKNEKDYKKFARNSLNFFYNVFLTIVSIFPLLGMLGTVLALLGLDLNAENDTLKESFFLALNTTAWGLISSIIFKFINSLVQNKIETAITKIDELVKQSYNK